MQHPPEVPVQRTEPKTAHTAHCETAGRDIEGQRADPRSFRARVHTPPHQTPGVGRRH